MYEARAVNAFKQTVRGKESVLGKTVNKKLVFIGLFLVAVSLGLFLIFVWDSHQQSSVDNQKDDVLVYQGEEYVLKNNIETYLILGLDTDSDDAVSDSYNNNQQADFIMLFVVDNETEKITVLHINRDTMADVNVLGLNGNKVSTVKKQIALAHTYGNGGDVSCRNTAEAVSSLLMDVKINHYFSLHMDALPQINDLVGGVTLEILEDLSSVDPSLVKGQTVTLDGEQALAYVRGRQGVGDGSNISRMARQKQYVAALRKQALQCMENDQDFVLDAAVKLDGAFVSDRSVTQMQQLADKFSEYEIAEIDMLEGRSVVGAQFMEFYLDEDFAKKTVVDLFYQLKD